MVNALLFRDVRILDPKLGRDELGDVLIEKGRIARAGKGAASGLPTDRRDDLHVIEGRGRWIAPGFIDLHAHLREPGEEYKEDIASGLRAAVAGGFVDVCAMPNTKPVNDTRLITEAIITRSREVALARLHPIGAITKNLEGKDLTEVADLRAAGAVAISDDGRCVTNSAVMRRALEYARTFDVPVIQHAEDHALTEGAEMHEGWVATKLGLRGWPASAEDVIVARDVILAEAATAEVTPHHLLLNHEAVVGYRTACKVNPPLREPEDVATLRKALADGTIDAIATDHAPHATTDKNVEFAAARPGMIGLEICLPLLLGLVRSGEVPLLRLLDALVVAPAKIVGLPRRSFAEGEPGDVVLIDPDARWTVARDTLASKSLNTPFFGETLQGAIDMTVAGGRTLFAREVVR
jgi:dihydroorotase